MTIQAGCLHAIAANGGRARQCAKTSVTTVTVKDDTGSLHRLPVCLEHYGQMADRRHGTKYTENAAGQGLPLRVTLVKLS